jgi:hypothetical protein
MLHLRQNAERSAKCRINYVLPESSAFHPFFAFSTLFIITGRWRRSVCSF